MENKNSWWILLAGLSIGYIIGVFTAPKPGKELREDIGKTINKGKEEVSDLVDKTMEKGKDLFEKGKTLVEKSKDLIVENTQKTMS